jgi:DNA-binding beta-propeller fold protein YncE
MDRVETRLIARMRVVMGSCRRVGLTAIACIYTLLGALVLASAPALAVQTRLEIGKVSSADIPNGFVVPAGLAIEQSGGGLYAADNYGGPGFSGAVDRFDKSGVFQNQITGAFTPQGALSEPADVAIDESNSTVYVTDTGNNLVDAFDTSGDLVTSFATNGQLDGSATPATTFSSPCGVAVDKGDGDLYVADSGNNRIWIFSDTGAYKGEIADPNLNGPCGLAFDSSGNLYVRNQNAEDIVEFDRTAPLSYTFISVVDANGATDVAVDPTDNHVFVDDGSQITEYDSSGTQVSQFGSGVLSFSQGVAVDGTSDKVYVSDGGKETIHIFGPVVTVPAVTTGQASNVQLESATLSGIVNSEATQLTDCHFDYGSTTAYGQTAPCVPAAASIPPDSSDHAVSAEITGLQPATTYHFRLEAANANAGIPGQDGSFHTESKAIVASTSATGVTEQSATLNAEINPKGNATTYRFEYGTTPSYGTSVPIPDEAIGNGTADVPVSRAVAGLQPHTIYHFRVIAHDQNGTTDGIDDTFTTQASGPELELPDNRAWELVSPPNKHGALTEPIGDGIVQAAAQGGAIAYVTNGPIEEQPQGSPQISQVISRRGSGGWSSQEIAATNVNATGVVLGEVGEYRIFSSDLSVGLLAPARETSGILSEEASAWTPYLRHDFVSSQSCPATPSTCWTPLVTSKEGYADVQPPGSTFPKFNFAGATGDVSHVVLAEAPSNLYEWTAAEAWEKRLQPVSMLPENEGDKQVCGRLGDYQDLGMGNAISHDGSRIFFEPACTGPTPHLYLRDVAKRETLRLDTVQPGGEQAQREAEVPVPTFQAASSDGSRVLFTDEQRLTEGSGSGDLYECEVHTNSSTGKLECALTDLTPLGSGHTLGLQGKVLGASEDASYVYFAANAVLAPGASAGECHNSPKPLYTCSLYVAHESEGTWNITFIATLSAAGGARAGTNSDWTAGEQKTSSVSPSGQWLAFTSDQPMPGYDNRDATSGQRDVEVYLFDAQAGQDGRQPLVCASCNPTGSRPVGENDEEINSFVNDFGAGPWSEQWVAAALPSLTRFALEESSYQSRYLSDSGRLFFDSHDALAPHDKNGTWDVYEYEPPASGQTPASDSCSIASDTYSERSGGCVSMISSGTSSYESVFLDASERGDDVFFLTAAKLVSQDVDTAYDVYDAHVCSAQSPCIAPVVSPPACTTSDSCRAAPVSQPQLFGPPPSATFAGVGNVVPAVKPKVLTRAQHLSRALSSCHKKYRRSKKRRATCERQARKSYGAKMSRASKSRKAKANRRGRR